MELMSPGPEIPSLPAWYYFPLPVGSLPSAPFLKWGSLLLEKGFLSLYSEDGARRNWPILKFA